LIAELIGSLRFERTLICIAGLRTGTAQTGPIPIQ
jgi:hypothetical protein